MAAAVGAANTLLPGPDGWIADNTDVAGIVAALAEHAVAPSSVTVLGAGGTAQAVLAALLGSASTSAPCSSATRRADGAAAATADRVGIAVDVGRARRRAPPRWAPTWSISTLPAGAADRSRGRPWPPGQAVLDVVYDPWPTPLAAAAAAAGAPR